MIVFPVIVAGAWDAQTWCVRCIAIEIVAGTDFREAKLAREGTCDRCEYIAMRARARTNGVTR